jgi:hypothetical protein
MTPPVAPEDDIGPYYKFIGFIALIAAIGLAFIHSMHGSMGWIDAIIVFILVMVCLALIRPTKFDNVIKTIADWLPFTRYTKGRTTKEHEAKGGE